MAETTMDTGNYRENVEANDVLSMAVGALVLEVDDGGGRRDDLVTITTDRGKLAFYHTQDCCESVGLEDVAGGDLADLVGQRIEAAWEDTNAEGPTPEYPDSWTWTFYVFRTNKTTLTLRFLGESNGYYSERVDVQWTPEDR